MKTQENIYQNYTELWNFNLQKIEEIHKELDKSIQDLDSQYAHFEPLYQKIEQILELLSAIYAHYNLLEGREQVRKLKSVIHSYKKYHTREGIDFKLLNYLSEKINSMRNHSFEDFPALPYNYDIEPVIKPSIPIPAYKNRPHKWLTFERNGSDFIVAFKAITIWSQEHLTQVTYNQDYTYTITINQENYTVKDLMPKSNSIDIHPHFLISIDEQKTYLADKICRKMYSEINFIKSKITPFKKQVITDLSPGRVRIFGKNHIFLN